MVLLTLVLLCHNFLMNMITASDTHLEMITSMMIMKMMIFMIIMNLMMKTDLGKIATEDISKRKMMFMKVMDILMLFIR